MKRLLYTGPQSSQSVYGVHMLITRNRDVIRDTAELVAVGMIDVDSVTRAMATRIGRGDKITVYSDQHRKEVQLRPEKNGYRFVNRPVGKLTHSIVIMKSAVDELLEGSESRVVLSVNGQDIKDTFMRRFSQDFNLPYVADWKDLLWQTCLGRGYIKELAVWTDPDFPIWRDIQAVEFTSTFDEEEAKIIISELLERQEIVLPEGVTDAPPLSEALKPDDEGKYHVTDYLQTYAPHLATTIEDIATPAHDLDKAIHPGIAQMKRVPFPAQAHTAQAMLRGFEEQKGVIAASDMGCGKSIIALATANAMKATVDVVHSMSQKKNGFSVLMLVPGITIPKWIRDEIEATLPHAEITVLENWHSVIQYWEKRKTRQPNLEFVLLSRDTAKLGMPKVPAIVYKDKTTVVLRDEEYVPEKPQVIIEDGIPKFILGKPDYGHVVEIEDCWICPDCGGVQTSTKQKDIKAANKIDDDDARLLELKLGFSDMASNSRDGVVTFKKGITDYHCSECGTNLMRDAVPEREKVPGLKHRRMQPAWFIETYMKNWFDLLVVDELHQYKSNSGQGEAMGMLVGAAKKVLGLTGTLSDGKSSSLYHLLWRISPKTMMADGFNHKSLNKFVSLYGAKEQKTRYVEDQVSKAGGSTGRRVIENPPKEVPGLSPKLFVNHLADKTVFLELGDMGLPLVTLEERPVFVDMDEEHQWRYTAFHNELESMMRQQYAMGNTGAFAQFIPAVVNAANQPHQKQLVCVGDDAVGFDPVEDLPTAKERRLIEDVKAELVQERKCVVYCNYTGKAGQDKHLAQLLQQQGINARVLSATVSPEDRVDWLEKAVNQNVDVVVCNAKLVEVGLDLLSFPTLMFYQFTDQVNVMRQAAKRAWRIGQHRDCKILYYTYKASYEMLQFKRMMSKRSHALLLEGRLDKSELAEFMELDDKSASTFNIASCLGDVEDLTQKWKTLADKDVPQGVTMLAEEEFKTEIKKAMQRLASETRRLAGVPEPTHEVAEPHVVSTNFVPKAAERAPLADVLPLFATAQDSQISEQSTKTAEERGDSSGELITVGQLRKSMGLVSKAKRVKRKDAAPDDQLALFAF